MEQADWSVLVPTASVIAAACLLRSTIPALLIGILVGHVMLDGPGCVAGIADSLVDRFGTETEAWAVLVCGLFGALIQLLVTTGGAAAFGSAVGRRITSARGTLLLAWGLGLVVFIDDYLNALVLGRTLRPIADRNRVPRERLAYVIDSTAAPMCLLVPLSTWAVYVAVLLETTAAAPPGEGLAMYLRIIPYTFYGWFAVLLVPPTIATSSASPISKPRPRCWRTSCSPSSRSSWRRCSPATTPSAVHSGRSAWLPHSSFSGGDDSRSPT